MQTELATWWFSVIDEEVLTLMDLSKQTERDDVIDDIRNRIKSMLKGMY